MLCQVSDTRREGGPARGRAAIRHDHSMSAFSPGVIGPGVIGAAGRYPLPSAEGPRAADLVLGGAPLPVAGGLRVYTCGITPYDVTHLGHAATFVWADLLTRVVRALEVRTHSCRNVTDVDDVL